MKTEDAVELTGERVRRLETAEPRPTLWETWHSAGAVVGAAATPIATPHRIYNQTGRDLTLIKVLASVGTGVTASDIILDVNMNGASIFAAPADQPRIVVGANTGTAVVTGTTTWPDGSYLTVDIDQQDIGGGAAANLTVQVVHHA